MKLLLCIMSMVVSVFMHAQIKGAVIDEDSQPIGYANVTLYSLPDSIFITGTITNELGQYAIDKIGDANSAFLKISALGYITETIYPIMQDRTIQLQPNKYSLNEIVVYGQ